MAGHERETDPNAGWGRSDKKTFTIVNGNTGANVEAVNLGRNYAYIIIRCDNCQYIAGSTTLGVKTAMDESQQLNSVYDFSSNTLTLLAPTLPTSGSMQFLLTPAWGAQYIHFTLSKNANGGSVVFDVYGVAESVAG
jgi:hypothetical protein